MIRKLDVSVATLLSAVAVLLGWSSVAHSQLYTVHPTALRARIASEDCNGNCRVRYEVLNNRKFMRLMCGIGDNEPIPRSYVVATFIDCEEFPSIMIGVWDRENNWRVCSSFDMSLVSAAHEESTENRKSAEFLYASEVLPIFATARARYGPLPRRLEMPDTACWLTFRTRSLNGALDEDVVIVEGDARGSNPIALYFDD